MKKITRKNGIVKSKFLLVCSQMPGLSHWPERDKPFDYRKSDVAQWLMAREEMWKWLFDKANDMGVIVFDPETKLWHGADTEKGRMLSAEKPAVEKPVEKLHVEQTQASGPLT